MQLKFKKNRTGLILSLVIFLLIILFSLRQYLFIPSLAESYNESLYFFKNWKLKQAENSLKEFAEDNNAADSIKYLYSSILISEGEINKVVEFLERTSPLNKTNNLDLLSNYCLAYYYNGQISRAIQAINKTLNLAELVQNHKAISEAYNVMGLVQFYKANYDSALYFQKLSLNAAEQKKLLKQKANALRQIAVINWYRGNLDSAETLYKKALKIYRLVNDKNGEATTLNDIGLIYFDRKKWFIEYPYHLRALRIQQSINDKLGLADTYYFLAYIPSFNKSVVKFKYNFLKKSYLLGKQIGYKWGEDVAKVNYHLFLPSNLAESVFVNPDSLKSDAEELKLITLWKTISEKENRADYGNIINLYEKASFLAEKLNYKVYQFLALIGYSSLLIKLNKLDLAEKKLLKAKDLTLEKNGRKYYYYTVDISLAEVYNKQGKTGEAVKLLGQTINHLDSIYFSNVGSLESLLDFESAISAVYGIRSQAYSLLYDILFEDKNYKVFFYYLTREKSLPYWGNASEGILNHKYSIKTILSKISNLEQSKDAEQEIDEVLNIFDKFYQKNQTGHKLYKKLFDEKFLTYVNNINQIQDKLSNKDIYLEFGFGKENLFCFVIRKNRYKIFRYEKSSIEIDQSVKFYNSIILRRKKISDDTSYIVPAKALGKLIFQPLIDEGFILPEDNIFVCPSRVLNQLPFSSLIIKEDRERFLIENHNLSFVANSNHLNELTKDLNIKSYLGVAPFTENLPNSLNEIKEIKQWIDGNVKVLKNKEASHSNVLKMINNYDFVHIATHSKVNLSNPLNSEIELRDKPLRVIELFPQKLETKIVFLSSCESGSGTGMVSDIPAEIDFISFPKTLLNTGAFSVIASRWVVEDKAAFLFTKYFKNYFLTHKKINYSNLSAAVCSAQRSFIRLNKKYSHPFFWSTFYLNK